MHDAPWQRPAGPVVVVLNPMAAGGSAARLRVEIERELAARALEHRLLETSGPGHAVELARAAAADGAPVIVAAGGDGTIHEVANGILLAGEDGARKPVLAVLPIGTGNDFAKLIEGSASRPAVYDSLVSGRVRMFDVGRVSWDGVTEFVVNAMGTGIDVEVVRQIDRMPRLRGVIGYLIALLRALVRFRPLPVRVRLDGLVLEQKIMIIGVGNGACVGGGFHLFPDAAPDDGWFDVCLVGPLRLRQVPQALTRVLRGTHASLPMVRMQRARSIEIEPADRRTLFFQLDGELRSAPRAHVSMDAAALPVLLPGSGGRP